MTTPLNTDELKSKLEVLLINAAHSGSMMQRGKTLNPDMFSKESAEVLGLLDSWHKQKCLELIGEDEQLYKQGYTAQPIKPHTVGEDRMVTRNVFRAELRSKLISGKDNG